MLSERVKAIEPSATLAVTAKAKQMVKDGKDVVILAAGEPDFHTPDNVKGAAIRAIQEDFTYYTAAGGVPELRQAICDKLKRENGLVYSPDEIVVSCGAKHTLYNLFQSLLDPTDEVIVFSPYWVSYLEQVRQAGGTPVILETDEKFDIDVNSFEKAITEKTKAVLLNSPNNPSGKIIPKKTLEKVVKLCIEHDVMMVSDEVYEHFVYDGKECVSPAHISKEARGHTVIVNAVSKTYSMTGWRLGFAAGPEELIKGMAALQSHQTSNPCSITQKAAMEAFKGQQLSVEEMRDAFRKRRDRVVGALNSIPGIRCNVPEGAFYAFPDISGLFRGTMTDSLELCKKMLDEVGVAVVPGSAFGREGHIRISYCTDEKTLKKGLARIKEFSQQKE